MTTGASIFPSVACCRRARYQAKKAIGARIGFVRSRFQHQDGRLSLAMPFYANLRGQKRSLPSSHPQPFNSLCNPRLTVITTAAKHHMSTVSNTRGLKPHLYRFTTHRQPVTAAVYARPIQRMSRPPLRKALQGRMLWILNQTRSYAIYCEPKAMQKVGFGKNIVPSGLIIQRRTVFP
jgi:hypothetical protein